MSTPQDYTMTRIRRDYLAKLQQLAEHEKRSIMKQLEMLIDAEEVRQKRRKSGSTVEP
jgi:hypothetical protein